MIQLSPAEWDEQWSRTYQACYAKKRAHMWAFTRAHEIMNEEYGLRPKEQKVHEPTLLDYVKLGLQLKRFKMRTFSNPTAWFTALGVAFTAASAQFAIANGDQVITAGEWAGVALQFFSLLLGTVAKFQDKQPTDTEGNVIDRRK